MSLDINDAKDQVYQAGALVEEVTREFLQANPYTSHLLSPHSNREMANRAIQSVLSLLHVFDKQSSFTDQVKQQTYLQFVVTMSELAQVPGIFPGQLREKNVMNKICESLGMLFYERPEAATQISRHLAEHVNIMKTTWNRPPLEERLTLRHGS